MRYQPEYEQQTGLERSTTAADTGSRIIPAINGREQPWFNEDTEAEDLSRERHYSVAELGKMWNLSEKTIRRMFENEPGVLQ